MTLTGFLILVTVSLILCAWLQLSALLRMKLKPGAMRFSKRGIRLLPSPYEAWLNACGMQPMAKGEATIQLIRRKGMDDLYVAGINGKSVAFYSVEQLSEWLMDQGISMDDPAWDYIDKLVREID
jgi:hypothetical protein